MANHIVILLVSKNSITGLHLWVLMDDWFAARTKRLEVSGIRKMFEMASEDAINLGLGELDFEPTEAIKEALSIAVKKGYNHYGPTQGIPELRQAIADKLMKCRVDMSPENIIITAGATQGLLVSALTLFDHGDEVLIPDPGFVLYEPHVIMCGAFPVRYTLSQENDFVPQPDEILELITPSTKAIIINSPNNPTAGMLGLQEVKALREIAIDNEIMMISDEVYDKIVYEGEHISILDDSYDNTIYINSFSKTFAMTGWRIGYLATAESIIGEISKMQYYNIACPSTPMQYATLEALKTPASEMDERVNILRKRRDKIVKRLNDIDGFTCLKPRGTFYTFPSYDFNISSEDLAIELLKAGLICVPGSAFGKAGEGHLRFSFANSIENIEKAMDIVEQVAAELPRD